MKIKEFFSRLRSTLFIDISVKKYVDLKFRAKALYEGMQISSYIIDEMKSIEEVPSIKIWIEWHYERFKMQDIRDSLLDEISNRVTALRLHKLNHSSTKDVD